MTSLLLLAMLGCTPKEDAGPALSVSPEAVDVGTVAVNESATATVVLANDGGGAIELLSASLVEGDSRAWSVAREGFEPLEGDVVTTLTVTFAPDAEGASPATLQIRSTDPATPSVYVTLDGVGGPSNADNDADGFSPRAGDCNDNDAAVFPGADEVCDGVDSDCDGTVPADEADADRDGWHLCDGDCDDADGAVHPEADERCDDKDTDCDGATPDRDDADADGYTLCDADCDDAEPAAFPGNPEVCDGADNDCSGATDDIDLDGDGASVCGALPDCDDADPTAFPLYVDAAATGGTGTELAPFTTLADALAALDTTCRTVGLFPGTYGEATAWSAGAVRLVGLAGDPAGVTLTPPAGERAFTITGGAVALENVSLVGARNAAGDGGAVLVSNATLDLVGVVATLNSTAADGGAVAVSSGSLTVDGCVFASNTAGDDGGAVALVSSTLVDTGSTYTDNAAIQGGGLFAVSSSLDLDGVTFEGNRASGDGGGLALDSVATLWLDRGLFASNRATARGGGAALNDVGAADGWLRNSRFLDNFADEGGGLAFTGSDAALVVANNTLVANTSDAGGAAILVASAEPYLWLWSNVFAWNVGDSGVSAGAVVDAAYNLGYATSSGLDYDGVSIGATNLIDDPLFYDFTDNGDPYDDDLTLGPRSPARDSGPPDGEGPEGYRTWRDRDGTENDRGYTGGQGGE